MRPLRSGPARPLATLVALLVAVAAGFAAPEAASAQSLFNSAGLGSPVDPVDGRVRALAGFGLGLQGGGILPLTDPGSAARIPLPSAVMVGQPTWAEVSRDAVDAGELRGTRFPLLGIAYPAFGGMVTVHLGSLLDQRFSGERPSTVDLGGTSYEVVDLFTQDGGVSSAGVGYARMVDDRVAVGITVSRYLGSVTRELTRDLRAVNLPGSQTFTTSGVWRYSGTSVTAGANADLGTVGRLAASATWSSGLEADPSQGTGGEARSYDLPLELRVGGTAVLAPGLALAASATYADWSGIEDDLTVPTLVGSGTGYGVGLELSQFRMLGRRAPLRVGYRSVGLPFGIGVEEGSERAFTGGFGFIFNEANGLVLGAVDLAVERGEREAGSVVERFWRGTVALRVAGF